MVQLILAATIWTLCAGAAWADVKYTTTSEVKLSGPLGTMINVMAKFGGASPQVVQKIYVKGDQMRADDGNKRTTLTDIAQLRTVNIDHEKKTFTALPFNLLRQAFRPNAMHVQDGQMSQQTVVDAEEGAVEVEVDVDFKVERTGKTKDIDGNKASQVFSTVTVDFKGEGQPREGDEGSGGSEGEAQQFEGTIVVASQLWMSQKVKGYEEVQDFHQRLAEAYAGELGFGPEHAETMKEALLSDPRIAQGLEEAAKEARKLEGIQLVNTTRVILVPAGKKYNAELAWGKKKKKRGFGGFDKGLAKKAAESKIGLDGDSEQGEAEEKPLEQTTIITLKTKMSGFKTQTLKQKLFQIPAHYDEIKLNMEYNVEE